MFAEYHREDGLVARISLFADADNDFNGEIKEIFRNRKDKLWQRVRNPDIDQVHEYFEPGRPHGLKDHIMQEGKTKEWHFYASSRSDGLVKRIEEPKKIMEYFVSRDDKLVYRSVAFDSLEMVARIFILLITDTFRRDRQEVPTSLPKSLTRTLP